MCEIMAEQDIRENAMSGGTPVRLRGLAANGSSISPTIQEVTNAMPVATKEEKGLFPKITGRSPLFLYKELNAGDTVTYPFDYGTVSLYSKQKGASWMFLLSSNYVTKIAGRDDIISTKIDNPSTVNIYKLNEDNIAIQNNLSEQFRFYIESF